MNKLLLMAAMIAVIIHSASAQLSGPLSGNIGPGTFLVDGDIYVPAESTLTIASNTDFLFDYSPLNYYEFEIRGLLFARGTAVDSIRFKPRIQGRWWGGLRFINAPDSSILEYCLITGGFAVDSSFIPFGGGIQCSRSNPVFRHCVITGNVAGVSLNGAGGGIASVAFSHPVLHCCRITRNSAFMGGGVYCSLASITLSECEILENNEGGGVCGDIASIEFVKSIISDNNSIFGGLYLHAVQATLSGCRIDNNYFGINGCCGSNIVMEECVITGNSPAGGIGCNNGGYLTIRHCLIAGNSSNWGAGGIAVGMFSSAQISNCTVYGNSADTLGGGIYIEGENCSVINTIVAGNSGGGIYLWPFTQGNSITFCDFYNNPGGHIEGRIPARLGIVSGLNANGHPCDDYCNIFLNPLFRGTTGDTAFHLTAASPCIDAGDPASPLDPDSTVADIGRYYFHQCPPSPLELSLTPPASPVQIPSTGGSFAFDVCVVNNSNIAVVFDFWTEAVLPSGNIYGPLMMRTSLTIPSGYTIMRELLQNVPGYAPPGNYTYVGKVGVYPDSVIDDDSFPFTKLAGDSPPVHNQGWKVFGWEDENEFSVLSSQSSVLSSSPNPFNASIAARFELRAASQVKLAIYDIAGREVCVLAEGFYPAGAHQAVWDATGMASGVYFARLEAGSEINTVKLLLVK